MADKASLDDIIYLIQDLNKKDLGKLYSFIGSELEKDSKIDEDLIHIIFTEVGERPPSISKFSRTENGKRWIAGQASFDKILSEIIDGKVYRKTQILALKKFLVGILIDDIKRVRYDNNLPYSLPLNIRTVCQFLNNFAIVFNQQFPGYSKNKLCPLIMSRLGGT